MDPWENLALQGVGGLGQLGLQFGQAYGQYWLSKEQAETQFDLQSKYRATFAPALPRMGGGVFLILAIVAVVLIARR